MQFVPWRRIADWRCNACGLCCKAYSVVISFQEWLNLVKNYGVDVTVSGIDKLYLKKKSDGSCIFLYEFSGLHLCGLQHMKPKACKIWPFKILTAPKYGNAKDAFYLFDDRKLYVYVDSNCSGIVYGQPSLAFETQTLREFVELALGMREEQTKSTANIRFTQGPYVSNHPGGRLLTLDRLSRIPFIL